MYFIFKDSAFRWKRRTASQITQADLKKFQNGVAYIYINP